MFWRGVALLAPLSAFVILPISFFLIKRSAARRGPQEDGSVLRFSLVPGMRFLIGLVVAALAGFSVLVLVIALSSREGWYAVLIPLVVLLAIFWAIPRTVVLDDEGIRQDRWLLPARQASWSEVATVSRGPNTGRIFVWAASGKIAAVFSPQMAGLHRFEHEIRIRAKHAAFEY